MKYFYQTPAVEVQTVDLSDVLTIISGTGTGKDVEIGLDKL